MPKLPISIQTAEGQVWVKDFCWRVTEELCEAAEYYPHIELNEQQRLLFNEELSDALHFLVEIYILLGIPSEELTRVFPFISDNDREEKPLEALMEMLHANAYRSSFHENSYMVIYNLGLCGNCLKNKRWKQTQVMTGEVRFKRFLHESFIALMYTFRALGFTAEDIYRIYWKKSVVNQFRQDTQY